MNLRHLCSAPNVHVYFDSWNNWLYLEWEGELTLPGVQHSCLAIARCFVAHAYPRILNNNAPLSRVADDVAPWLTHHFFPYLTLAGVQQLAWVYGPSLRGQHIAEQVLGYVGPQVCAQHFAEAEQAIAWLQRVRPSYSSGVELLPRLAGQRDAKLKFLLKAFEQEVATTRALPAAPTPALPALLLA